MLAIRNARVTIASTSPAQTSFVGSLSKEPARESGLVAACLTAGFSILTATLSKLNCRLPSEAIG
jgi:hypothetical protein